MCQSLLPASKLLLGDCNPMVNSGAYIVIVTGFGNTLRAVFDDSLLVDTLVRSL